MCLSSEPGWLHCVALRGVGVINCQESRGKTLPQVGQSNSERDNQGHFDPLCVSCKWVKCSSQLLQLYHAGRCEALVILSKPIPLV